jgi:hypothetical protein
MLREECDKIFHGKCGCLGGKQNTSTQSHWCNTQTSEVKVIDTYHLPPGTNIFYMANQDINFQSRSFMDKIKNGEKCLLKFSVDPQPNGHKIVVVDMTWPLESDFLPSWIWMIESGYNKQRDEYHAKHNVKFHKKVITKTANFTLSTGPYTTKTEFLPYHVDLNK